MLHVLRPFLVANKGAVILEEEVAWPPGFNVFPCGGGGGHKELHVNNTAVALTPERT